MKYIVIVFLLVSGVAIGQTPPAYTKINARYDWLAGKFDSGLHIPAYDTVPRIRTNVWVGAGNIGLDSFNNVIYYYSSGQWWSLIRGSGTVVPSALTRVNDANVTITLTGNSGTALLQPVVATLGWTGSLAATRGGTGTATVATGNILYGSAADTWSKLAIGSAGQVLTVAGGIPSWATPAAGTVTTVTGTSPIFSSGGATPAISLAGLTTLGTAGQSVRTNSGATGWEYFTPSVGTITSVSGTTNRITSTGGTTPVIDISASYVGQTSLTTLGTVGTGVWNGTVITVPFGGTGASTLASNGVLYGNSTGAVQALAVNSGALKVLSQTSSGVPTWVTTTSFANTPTWQQTLTAGSVLTTNNAVDKGATQFSISGTDATGLTKIELGVTEGEVRIQARQLPLSGAQEGTYINMDGALATMVAYAPNANETNSLAIEDGRGVELFSGAISESTWKSEVAIQKDSIRILPRGGILNIDSLRTWTAVADTAFKRLMTWDERNGRWEYYDGQFPYNQTLATTDVSGNALVSLSLTGTSFKVSAGDGISISVGGTTGAGVATINSTLAGTDLNGFDFTNSAGAFSVTTTVANTRLVYSSSGAVAGVSGVTSDGTNVTAGSGNLRATRPRITTSIDDINGAKVIGLTTTTTPVNFMSISNADAGSNPIIRSEGSSTDIGLDFSIKGNSYYQFYGTSSTSAMITLGEDTDNGADYLAFKAPASITSSIVYTWVAPPPASTGYALSSDVNGNLFWAANAAEPMPIASKKQSRRDLAKQVSRLQKEVNELKAIYSMTKN